MLMPGVNTTENIIISKTRTHLSASHASAACRQNQLSNAMLRKRLTLVSLLSSMSQGCSVLSAVCASVLLQRREDDDDDDGVRSRWTVLSILAQ